MNLPIPDPIDRVGRTIHIGDTLVYAAMQGQTVCLNYGKVVDLPVYERDEYITRATRDSQGNWVPAQKKTVQYFKLKVQPLNDDGTIRMTRNYRSKEGGFVDAPARVVTLEFPNRTAVINH
jgi:hypothetical protein